MPAQRLNLSSSMASLLQGTPGLFKETLERELPPRGLPTWSRSGPLLGVPDLLRYFQLS